MPTGIPIAGGIPSGGIIFWSGSVADIPAGWVFCDGANGTPDLRDLCVIGAKQDDAGVAKTNVTGALTQSGGSVGHGHDFATNGHDHGNDGYYIDVNPGSGASAWDASYNSSSNSDDGTTEQQSDVAVPYYALAYIMKT